MPAPAAAPKRISAPRRFILGAGLALAVSPVLTPVARALGTPGAEATVERFVGRIFALIRSGGDRQVLRAALGTAIEAHADVVLIGRLSLGRLWRQASPEQQAQYQNLFRSFMLLTFSDRLVTVATDGGGAPSLELRGSQPVGRKDVVVRSVVRRERAAPLAVDWRLREGEGGYAIIDLVVEGVSLLVTQRSEFASIVERESFEALLDQLRSRTAALA